MSIKTMNALWLGSAVLVFGLPVFGQQTENVIEPGKAVEIEYTMSLDDDTVVTSNVGAEPIQYVHGEGQLFPRLEEALAGMRVDEERSVTLEAEDAYGLSDPDAIFEVPKESVPEDAREVGAVLIVEGVDWPVLVDSVTEDGVVLDVNHPLAGKTLRFDVRVISIS